MTCLARERTDPVEDQDLMTRGYPWPSTRKRITALLAQCLEFPTVLDLRPGPWPCAGFPCLSDGVLLVTCDALADANSGLQGQRTSEPVAYREKRYGEELLQRLDSDKFDLVFARDWVDRCRDPQEVIGQILRVVKPGGFALMEHRLCSAGQQADGALRRWGLSTESPARFDIRFQEDQIRLSHELGAACQIECERTDPGEYWLIMKIHKNR